jgi:hypothetical protein
VKTSRGVVIGATVAATFAIGVAAVWVTGDARAFGVIVTLAGVVAGVVPVRHQVRHVIASLYTDDRRQRPI